MNTPERPSGHDSCYCKGWRWLVTRKLHKDGYSGGFSVHSTKEEVEEGAIPHKDYYPGDIIEDRYFTPGCIFVENGSIELYEVRASKYHSIDDPRSANG